MNTIAKPLEEFSDAEVQKICAVSKAQCAKIHTALRNLDLLKRGDRINKNLLPIVTIAAAHKKTGPHKLSWERAIERAIAQLEQENADAAPKSTVAERAALECADRIAAFFSDAGRPDLAGLSAAVLQFCFASLKGGPTHA